MSRTFKDGSAPESTTFVWAQYGSPSVMEMMQPAAHENEASPLDRAAREAMHLKSERSRRGERRLRTYGCR